MENDHNCNENPINSCTIQKYQELADQEKVILVMMEKLPISLFQNVQVIGTAKHSVTLTNGSSQKIITSGSSIKITTSAEVSRDKSMKSDSIRWRKTKYGRNRSHYNNAKLYSLIQLHNHFIHIINFLIGIQNLLVLDKKKDLIPQ